ncbi:hypothetical protein [Kordia jejudonensis]|uniref:hypothetical protein n=1 Tax=Kordia jejudonensis TaxID=1348245 RepID=UPI000628FAA0|nr:hypothetical protein [Kordia jejudonensis]
MKHKLPFLISISCFLLYKLLQYSTGNRYIALLVFLIPITVLLINMILRKKLRYKSWFLSKHSFFLEKKSSTFTSAISKELLFQKLQEVTKSSSFRLVDSNSKSSELLLTTAANFWTWGENLYIEIKEGEKETSLVNVTAVTIYGSYSWNRNHKNYQHFYESFQQSLTI